MVNKKNRSKRFLLLVVLMSTLWLFACDNQSGFKKLKESIDNLKQTISAHKKKTNSVELSLPVVATYKATALRPPFEGPQVLQSAKEGVLNPLQAYPLSMLKFVGTLAQDNVTFAYILAPDNRIYQVKIGDVIGNHYGRIVNISATRLDVSEQSSEKDKSITRNVVTLELKDEH